MIRTLSLPRGLGFGRRRTHLMHSERLRARGKLRLAVNGGRWKRLSTNH